MCNVLFSRNTDQIVKAVDQTYVKLRELCNAVLPSTRQCTESETFSSLDLTMDDAIWILSHLRELFSTSDNDEQKRLMTMLPSTWGRHRIANWSSGTRHQARKSLELRTTSGILSYPEDRRGNKPLDNETEKVVLDFYISDEISRETSSKKEVIHPPPNRTPTPLRFLHMTVAETFEHFKTKYPDVEIARSKFFSLRPIWVKERTPHETCLCIYHENADLLLQVNKFASFLLNL